MSKSKLRAIYRERRHHVSSCTRMQAAKKAADIFTQLPLFKQSEHFACYLPVKNEFDTTSIIEAIWQAKKACYLPVLPQTTSQEERKSLIFVRYEVGDPLHLNRYAILEPIHTDQQISAASLDVVLIPLIAFDLIGNRLGTGGGYYDRTFAFVRENNMQQAIKKPILLGLAYAKQQAPALPHDPWDISLNGVVTENEFIFIV